MICSNTVVHHLVGSKYFAKGDKVHGNWQVDVEEESRKCSHGF